MISTYRLNNFIYPKNEIRSLSYLSQIQFDLYRIELDLHVGDIRFSFKKYSNSPGIFFGQYLWPIFNSI